MFKEITLNQKYVSKMRETDIEKLKSKLQNCMIDTINVFRSDNDTSIKLLNKVIKKYPLASADIYLLRSYLFNKIDHPDYKSLNGRDNGERKIIAKDVKLALSINPNILQEYIEYAKIQCAERFYDNVHTSCHMAIDANLYGQIYMKDIAEAFLILGQRHEDQGNYYNAWSAYNQIEEGRFEKEADVRLDRLDEKYPEISEDALRGDVCRY